MCFNFKGIRHFLFLFLTIYTIYPRAIANAVAVPSLAIVSVSAGNVNVTSAVDAGPIKVALFVPFPLFSKNSMKPADVEPFFTDKLALKTSLAADVAIPVWVVVPLISTAPLMSMVVALSSNSVSDTKSRTPSALWWIYVPVSPNVNLFVPLSVRPVPSVCVRVVSPSAPNERT